MERIIVLLVQTPVASFIFLITLVTSIAAFRNPELLERFALRPHTFANRNKRFTVVTSGLVHANWQHLIFNMLTYYFFAFTLERFFLMLEVRGLPPNAGNAQVFAEVLGHAKFFVLYFACMIVADLTTILKYRTVPSYSAVGASGALSGVVVSLIMLGPSLSDGLSQIRIFGVIPGWMFALVYILGSYFSSKRGMMSRVAHEAHLWGSLAGIFFTAVMFPEASWDFVLSVVDWWRQLRA